MIEFTRRGGFKPPPDNERLIILDDGQFRLWRSVSWTTYPPTPIGNFAGRLSADQQTKLQAALVPIASKGKYHPRILPDSSIDVLKIDGKRRAVLGDGHDPEGPWEAIITLLRAWFIEMTAFPQRAIGLEVAADGRAARLAQLGPQSLHADLRTLSIHAVLWQDQWQNEGEWWAPAESLTPLVTAAEPAWPVELPFAHGFAPADNQEVVAYVNFAVDGADALIPVTLESPRRLL